MRAYDKTGHTFVVCAYEESPYLEACVRSLLKQTVRTEIVIATSTPNDHIKGIAEKYHLLFKINAGGKGIAEDWNFACSCAETPLVTLAHQDDIYEKEYIQEILAALQHSTHPLIAFSDYTELRGNVAVDRSRLLTVKRLMLTPLRIRLFWNSRMVRRRILSMGNAICCPAVTFVKESLPEPLFKNNMKSNIDWQAWEEISRLKGGFVYVPKRLMKHRLHEQSTTYNLIEANGRKCEDLYMFRKFWPAWAADIIDFFYQKNEKSNSLK